MKKNAPIFIAVWTLAALAAGCFSATSYQLADTVPKGGTDLGFGFSAFTIPTGSYTSADGEKSTINDDDFSGTLPNPLPDILMRFGLGDNIDIGFKLFFLGLQGDFKWRFVNTPAFSMAIAPGIYYSRPFIVFGQYGLTLPLLFTFKIGEHFSIYGNVRGEVSGWNLEVESGGSDEEDANIHTAGFGATLGFSFGGKRWYIRPEVNYTRFLIGFEESCEKVDIAYFTYGFGFGFLFGVSDDEQDKRIKELEDRLQRLEGQSGPAKPAPAPAPAPAPTDDEIRKRADDAASDLQKEEDRKASE